MQFDLCAKSNSSSNEHICSFICLQRNVNYLSFKSTGKCPNIYLFMPNIYAFCSRCVDFDFIGFLFTLETELSRIGCHISVAVVWVRGSIAYWHFEFYVWVSESITWYLVTVVGIRLIEMRELVHFCHFEIDIKLISKCEMAVWISINKWHCHCHCTAILIKI